jgi:RimJ/RimL family protein N-acetyltransferase
MKRIITPRLVLKAMSISDCDNLRLILGDPETAWWFDSFVLDDRRLIEFFIHKGNMARDNLQYGIYEKGSDIVIGLVQVYIRGNENERELGYVLSKDYRGKGYMTEVVKAVCDRIFYNPAVDAVTLRVLPANLPSQAVARKVGFVLESQKEWERDTTFLDNLPMDRLVLTRERNVTNKRQIGSFE